MTMGAMARRSWADITEEEFAEEAEAKVYSWRDSLHMRAAWNLHADIISGRVGPDLAILRAKHLAKESPPAAAWLCAAVIGSIVEPGPLKKESICSCRTGGWTTTREDCE